MRERKRAIAFIVLALMVSAGSWLGWRAWRERGDDPAWSEQRELARYVSAPPTQVVIPDDVALPTVPLPAQAAYLDPLLVDVSLGKRSVRLHGREALEVPRDGAAGFPASLRQDPRSLALTELGNMVEWQQRANAAVIEAGTLHGFQPVAERDDPAAHLLVDGSTPYELVGEVLVTLVHRGVRDFDFVVRDAAGRLAPFAGTTRRPDHTSSVFVRFEGTDLLVTIEFPREEFKCASQPGLLAWQRSRLRDARVSAIHGHVDRAALVAKIRESFHVATSHDDEGGPTEPPYDVLLVPLADTPFEAIATVLSAVREGRDDGSAPTIFWLPSVAKPLGRCETDGGAVGASGP